MAAGELEGYASLFNVVDAGGDIVLPGAFVNLKDFLATGVVTWAHDMDRPVAMPIEAVDDGVGLRLRAGFHGTSDGIMARQVLTERQSAGVSPFGLSIGYILLQSGQDAAGHRLLRKIYLLEVGLVAMPMNFLARVSRVKGLDAAPGKALNAAELERARLLRGASRFEWGQFLAGLAGGL